MRRADRQVTHREELLDIMARCQVCRLALNDGGWPYVIPLSFGVRQKGEQVELLFHSALEGHKVALMQADPRAAFEMDCGHQLQYLEDRGYCTMAYESVVGRGRVRILPEEEKLDALRILMAHYHPEGGWFNPAALPRTLVYALAVEEMSGKRKPLK